MSRVFNFDIQYGQIYIDADDDKFTGVYKTGWKLLTNHEIEHDEWVIVFNLLGPAIAKEIKVLFPSAPQRMINEFITTLGADDPEIEYMMAMEDEISRFTHVLRSRFEVILKAARGAGANSQVIIDKHLTEIKQIFPRVPKYCITSVHETLTLFQNR